MEEEVLATLEGSEEVIEDEEEPPIFLEDEKGTLVILRLNFGIGREGEGSRGGLGRDEWTNSDLEPSNFEVVEWDKDMDDPNIEWMTVGPLALPAILHKIPRQAEKMNIKFNPNNAMNS